MKRRNLFSILPILCLSPDGTEGAVAEATNAPVAEDTKPPITFEVESFIDGPFKGFKFTVPQYSTLAAAVAAHSEEAILDLFNTQVSSRIRSRVKNGLPKDLKPSEIPDAQAKLREKHPDGVLFTQEEAAKWKPEASRLGPNKLFKLAKEAFAKGDMLKGNEYLMQMAEALKAE